MPNGDSANRAADVLDLQAEAQVGLVGPVDGNRLGVRHAAERPRESSTPISSKRGGERALDDLEDQFRRGERHLEVDLRELELPVGAQRLVAEAAGDLHVAVEARDHQDLLEELRRLRQRVELARMHAARHQEVARAFRRGLREDRRLDLVEALVVEVAAQRHRERCRSADVAAAAAAGAGRDSGTAAASLPRRSGRRRSRRAASSLRSAGAPPSRALRRRRSAASGSRSRATGARPRPSMADDELAAQALGALEQAGVVLRRPPGSRRDGRGCRGRCSDPRSRTRCTHPSSTVRAPTSATRRAPQVCVRAREPSCSAT